MSILRAHKLAASSHVIPARLRVATRRRQTAHLYLAPLQKKGTTQNRQLAEQLARRTNSLSARAQASPVARPAPQLALILPWEAHRTTTSSARVGTIRDTFPAMEPLLPHRSKPSERRFVFLLREEKGACTEVTLGLTTSPGHERTSNGRRDGSGEMRAFIRRNDTSRR